MPTPDGRSNCGGPGAGEPVGQTIGTLRWSTLLRGLLALYLTMLPTRPPYESNPNFPTRATLYATATTRGSLLSLIPSRERQGPQDRRADPYRGCSYSVSVLLKLLAELARGSGSRACGSALATRAGRLRKTANVIHPLLTSSSNAPRTEKRSGRGAVRSVESQEDSGPLGQRSGTPYTKAEEDEAPRVE